MRQIVHIYDITIHIYDRISASYKHLWDSAKKQIRDPRFKEYIQPADNTAVHLINAYEKYKK